MFLGKARRACLDLGELALPLPLYLPSLQVHGLVASHRARLFQQSSKCDKSVTGTAVRLARHQSPVSCLPQAPYLTLDDCHSKFTLRYRPADQYGMV